MRIIIASFPYYVVQSKDGSEMKQDSCQYGESGFKNGNDLHGTDLCEKGIRKMNAY